MKKRILALLLASLLAFTFAACGDKETSSTPAASTPSGESTASETISETSAPEELEYTLPTDDFSDTVINVLGKKDGAHYYSRTQWEADETATDVVNVAVAEREAWLEDNLGISINYIANPNNDEYFITQTVENMIYAGTNQYDIVCDGLTTMASLAVNGDLLDLSTASKYLDLNKSWWDSRVSDALSIENKVYYAAGDIIITDDDYTYCTLYSKNLIEQYNIADMYDGRSMYDIVRDGDWTYDTMFDIANVCTHSLTGSADLTYADVWGVIADIGALQVFMAGSGYQMASKDNEDVPSLSVMSESATNLFTKLTNLTNGSAGMLFTERMTVESYYAEVEKIFAENRAAFYVSKLSALTSLIKEADATDPIGVLPIPKYSADQDGYYNSAATLHFSCVAIPISNKDKLDATCAAMQALGYMGQQLLTPAYIEKTLKIKNADDTPDSEMIDLVLNTRAFDLACVYDWGGLNSFFNQFAGSGNTNFVSTWQSVESAAQAAMQETVNAFTGK